jgi:tocopherol O-methyltransferase
MEPIRPLDVATYYDHTRFDYRVMWSRRSRAVHFGYYDEHADKHAAALHNLNRVLADLAGIKPGERVLDAGCGWGSACIWLARHRQALATGISIVPAQINDCQIFALKKGIANVHFLQADFCQMPFANDSFDVVWACESICHAAQKLDFYREAYRVLKPGGRLVLAEYIRAERPASPSEETLLAAWLRPWAIPDLDTTEEHRAHVLAAGFSVCTLQDVTPQVQVSLRNLYELCSNWLRIGRVLRWLRIVNDVRLNNVRASIRQYEALQAGAWWYGLLLAKKSPAPEEPERG